MKILVLMKQTIDTEETITINNGIINEDGVKFIVNPYDEYAIEEAVSIKEKHGGEVTVISIGPNRTQEALRTALAMGADNAIFVDDERAFGDELTISKVLTKLIRDQEYDIILAGHMTVDYGSSQVGPRVAEMLNIPHISTIVNLEVEGNKAVVERDVEGNVEIIEVVLPALFTTQQGLNEPRYPSIPAMMKAKKKKITRFSLDDLGLCEDEVKPKTELVDQFLPPKKGPGRILQGSLQEQVQELVHLLKNEEKVI